MKTKTVCVEEMVVDKMGGGMGKKTVCGRMD